MVHHFINLVAAHSPPVMLHIPRGICRKEMSKSNHCVEQPVSVKFGVKQVIAGLAASAILLSQINQLLSLWTLSFGAICHLVAAVYVGFSFSELHHASKNKFLDYCENFEILNHLEYLANAADSSTLRLPLKSREGNGMMMMMRAMTVKNFDPTRYAGRWFEVASLKRGFAGQGQEDCHCTQGIYTFDLETPAIQVDTFCIHGGPAGYITGIRGKVQCLSEEDKNKTETDLERQEMIREKCYLRFPTLPFIPKEPYDVIATDYTNYALVSGAKDKSFVQIYSRTPNPGPEFIEKYKSYLANFGYDPSAIKDTPQDCEVMSNSQLTAMMSISGMQRALTNQFPDLELKSSVEFNPFTSVFDTLKKLVELYFKK